MNYKLKYANKKRKEVERIGYICTLPLL